MGHSNMTVLETGVRNFKKGFSRDYGFKMTPERLRTLCELEWPCFEVGWPPEGTLDIQVACCVWQVVTGKPGHPDQFPYIDPWLEIAQTLPPWVRFSCNRQGQAKVLVTSAKQSTGHCRKIVQPRILPSDPEGEPIFLCSMHHRGHRRLAPPTLDALPPSASLPLPSPPAPGLAARLCSHPNSSALQMPV